MGGRRVSVDPSIVQRALSREGGRGREDSSTHGLLEDGLVEVVPPALSALRVDVGARGGKDPLPGPLPTRRRKLAGQSVWNLDPAGVLGEIAVVLLPPHVLEVRGEVDLDRRRQHSSRRSLRDDHG